MKTAADLLVAGQLVAAELDAALCGFSSASALLSRLEAELVAFPASRVQMSPQDIAASLAMQNAFASYAQGPRSMGGLGALAGGSGDLLARLLGGPQRHH